MTKSRLADIVSDNTETILTNWTNKAAKAITQNDTPFKQDSTNKIDGIYIDKIFCPAIPITCK